MTERSAAQTPVPLLSVDDLKVHFKTAMGTIKAVDGVSFQISPGETLAVVGESGSGKSVTSLTVMGLLSGGQRHIAGGSIRYDGKDMLAMSDKQLRALRGGEISMIFQEPMTSLNPVYMVGAQIAEAVRLHLRLNRSQAKKRALEMLELVGIPEPQTRMRNYPHELSGGMRQRVMIAMALACNPRLLIADEPTTALDVTIQAQILELIKDLQKEFGMAVLFITHDLGVVAEMADRVVVMYSGRAVEEGTVEEILLKPQMPYTMGLINSIPKRAAEAGHVHRLQTIPGNVPNPLSLPTGCSFHPRCYFARDQVCNTQVPELIEVAPGRKVRCARYQDIQGGQG
ncbi:ABC transporter ATP-binding protein [Yoonia sp.]|uniref:ABC transporter ATP-binding protein n=1 Tax=Yoonia sp. TaxID=2212373 RepID=UPI003A4D42A9